MVLLVSRNLETVISKLFLKKWSYSLSGLISGWSHEGVLL